MICFWCKQESRKGLFMTSTIIAIVAAVVVIGWAYSIYVSLIQKRNKTQEAFSSIDVQLKKRYDLIPNILTIAQKVMELPSNFENIDRKIALDGEIAKKMGQIMVAVENYPQLKSDQTMITAMQTYNEVEEHIAAARRFYNSAALELKNAVEIFPSSFFARMMNIKPTDFFKAEEKERQAVNAADFLK